MELPHTPLVITFASHKGGNGKSTAAMFTAQVLHGAGYRVRVLDADPQGSSWEWKEDAAALGKPLPFEVTFNASRSLHRERATLASGWDVTIIDCPPESQTHATGSSQAGMIVKSAVRAADIVITPLQPTVLDLKRLSPFIQTVEDARHDESRPIVHIVHFSRVDRRSTQAAVFRQAIDAMAEAPPVCNTDIPLRAGFAYSGGSPLTENDSLVALYRELTGEILDLAGAAFGLSTQDDRSTSNVLPIKRNR